MRIADKARAIRVILLDIEGTTTPVDVVTKTLFPYASERLEVFLREHAHEAETQALLRELQEQYERDQSAGLEPPAWRSNDDEARMASAVGYLRWLIARDSKCTPLKTLQGRIWEQGYARGELHGAVYEDVPRAMKRWKEQGITVAIFSSGSVLAQQLLFRTTEFGDLTTYISGFFDTQIGAKWEVDSYRKIAAALGHSAGELLFISDAGKEIEAAQRAGIRVALCDRGGSLQNLANGRVIRSFDEIELE